MFGRRQAKPQTENPAGGMVFGFGDKVRLKLGSVDMLVVDYCPSGIVTAWLRKGVAFEGVFDPSELQKA
jgi:uncharacterized protein YodC (DUF2158 family)